MKTILLYSLLCIPVCLFSQEYNDYLGAGHSDGITVTSSHQESRTNWDEIASADNTINGSGLDARLLETSRFLAQATFGSDLDYIKTVAEQPFEDWIGNQFDIDSPSMGERTQSIFERALARFVANGGAEEDYHGPFWGHFQYAWWESNIDNDDLLRQRIALALSEILVVSFESNLSNYGIGLGNRIPTYDNDDIKEFAKIFTGLGPGSVRENPWGKTTKFGVGAYLTDKDVPMAMYDEFHEPGEKHLLNGMVVPSGRTGMQDIDAAIDNLFNHQNVGPFIAKRLIQQLVKSNPSPAYISRVSGAFNNTKGVRGDMKAVIKAILLDDEARSCSWTTGSR